MSTRSSNSSALRPDSVEDAVSAALKRAGETLRNLRWFEVVQIRGNINKGVVAIIRWC